MAGTNGSTNPNDALDGSYTLTLSSCTPSSAWDGFPPPNGSTSYSVTNHSTNGGFQFFTNGPAAACAYSLAFTGAAPAPTLAVEAFTQLNNNPAQSQWAYSATVQTFSPPPAVPDAPIAVLLPLTGVLTGGGLLAWKRRRDQRPAASAIS
jgi:hypothetical protein